MTGAVNECSAPSGMKNIHFANPEKPSTSSRITDGSVELCYTFNTPRLSFFSSSMFILSLLFQLPIVELNNRSTTRVDKIDRYIAIKA